MEVWEYIIATTIMEEDRERRAQKQKRKQGPTTNTGEGSIPGLIIALVIWIVCLIAFSRL